MRRLVSATGEYTTLPTTWGRSYGETGSLPPGLAPPLPASMPAAPHAQKVASLSPCAPLLLVGLKTFLNRARPTRSEALERTKAIQEHTQMLYLGARHRIPARKFLICLCTTLAHKLHLPGNPGAGRG